jgi:hypothetical protein
MNGGQFGETLDREPRPGSLWISHPGLGITV